MKQMNYRTSRLLKYKMILIFLCSSIIAKSQFEDFIFPSDSTDHNGYIDMEFGIGYDSNSINTKLLKSFFKGGYIDRSIFEESYPNHVTNRLGALANIGFEISKPWSRNPKNKYNLLINLKGESLISSTFNEDLYGLVFIGNQQFKGDTATFEKSNLEQWTYASLGFGLHDRSTDSKISLGVYMGISRSSLSIDQGYLYTSDDGQLLSSDLDATYLSNTTPDSTQSNGYGLGLNGIWNIPLNDKQDILSLRFSNIGFMSWPDKLSESKMDSTYVFEGIDISNILHGEVETKFDSIYIFKKTYEKKTELLPVKLSVNYRKEISGRNYINLGIHTQMINRWIPEYRLGFLHKIKNHSYVGAELKYGGYGGANINLHTSFLATDNWNIQLNAGYLLGMLSPKSHGTYIGIGLKRLINFKTKTDE